MGPEGVAQVRWFALVVLCGFWVFLYLVHNLPQLHMQLFLIPYSFFVFCC